MSAWNFATIWEIAADTNADLPAVVQGERVVSWRDFDRRADGIARTLLDRGAQHQDKVAQYLYNCPEYLESMFGAFKAGLVPANTNYRYADDELLYLWDNADAVCVVFHGSFAERIERIRDRLPKVTTWLWVDDSSGPCPDWALPYETAAATETERVTAPWGREDDDLLLMYTGGTTGMPKGVMWRQDSLVKAVVSSSNPLFSGPADYDAVRELLSTSPPGGALLPGPPLMHGTAQFTTFIALSGAGQVVLLESRHFEIEEMLDTIDACQVNSLIIVGDVFAKPMVKALDGQPDRWNLSSLFMVTSSGVMWSEPVKQGMLRHNPDMFLIDVFSSSEALGMGASVSSGSKSANTAKFTLGENARVIGEDGTDVEPGSDQTGRVAVKGLTPIGYYKDPEKSAATFVLIDGETYSMPGDYARIEADGSLTLLGRGSQCINTGGEKVYPEEVEEILKEHSTVMDAAAVGLPDDTFGEAITAVVQANPGDEVDEAVLITWVKSRLAHYKAPKHIVAIDTVGRAPNGKVDYRRLKAYAASELGVTLPT
jgi:acyl-CoA synthetase (AMP-forming)/AMP-acid ligase II